MDLVSMFTSKDSANGGGIFGMVKKFEDALAAGQQSAAEGLQIQLAILAELRALRVLMEQQHTPPALLAGDQGAHVNPAPRNGKGK